jgi:hypothetical protein
LIGLSPLPTAHPEAFQRLSVRPSTPFYRGFSLAMGRSQSFASAPTDSSALFRLAFAPAAPVYGVNLASEEQLVGSLCKRHAVTPIISGLRPLVGARFQVLFTPLFTVLFTFPSRYSFTIGLPGVFSLAGWCRPIQPGFLPSRPTQDTRRAQTASPTGLSPPAVRLPRRFGSPFVRLRRSYNPLDAVTSRVWAIPRPLAATDGITIVFSSSGYLDVSVPRVRLPEYSGIPR